MKNKQKKTQTRKTKVTSLSHVFWHSEWDSWKDNTGKIDIIWYLLFDINRTFTNIKELSLFPVWKKSVILIKNYLLRMHSKVSMGEWYVIWNCLVNDLAEEKLAKRWDGKCVCGQCMHATHSLCILLPMCSKFPIIIFSKGKFNWKANLSINILCWPQSLTSCAFQESSMYSVKVNKAKKDLLNMQK